MLAISLGFAVLILAFYWLMRETGWLRVKLIRPGETITLKVSNEVAESIVGIMPLIIFLGFIATFRWLGFRKLRRKQRAISVDPLITGWYVSLLSPSGKDYGPWTLVGAERIARKHGWSYQ